MDAAAYDERRTFYLEQERWRVVRLWNNEVIANPDGAAEQILLRCAERLGGTQTITPRVQLVASPRAVNNGIPNEDSRSIELEDINLFDLNRFPGFDRWEGGSRVTYGLQYTLTRPISTIQSCWLSDWPRNAPTKVSMA